MYQLVEKDLSQASLTQKGDPLIKGSKGRFELISYDKKTDYYCCDPKSTSRFRFDL